MPHSYDLNILNKEKKNSSLLHISVNKGERTVTAKLSGSNTGAQSRLAYIQDR